MITEHRVRDTSIEAYRAIEESGMLSERRWQVYHILFHNGPLTGSQVATIWKNTHGRTAQSETIRNRISELRDMGCVAEIGEVRDEQTEMTVLLFDVTSNLPTPYQRKETSREKIARLEKLNNALLIENRRLRMANESLKQHPPNPAQQSML